MRIPRIGRAVVPVAILAILAATGLGLFAILWASPGGLPETRFAIGRGESAASVARRLQEGGLVRSAGFFSLAARVTGSDVEFKAGQYDIPARASVGRILRDFSTGRQATIRVTVPEGYTARMIGALLEAKGIVPANEFLAVASDRSGAGRFGFPGGTLEGYLFPDTYLLAPGMDAEGVAKMMTDAFRTVLASIPGASDLEPARLRELVILASIVEREYRVPEEAPLIASVFLNRLRIRMALQSCATVVYVLTEKMGRPHPETVRLSDLQIADPYNTYRQRDLPPGPISNPGRTALRAVFVPASTDYLYFRLTDADSGRHRFSTTLEEHANASLNVKGFR